MGGRSKNENLGSCAQTPPEVYGKVNWMATSERVNLLVIIKNHTFSFVYKFFKFSMSMKNCIKVCLKRYM